MVEHRTPRIGNGMVRLVGDDQTEPIGWDSRQTPRVKRLNARNYDVVTVDLVSLGFDDAHGRRRPHRAERLDGLTD